MIDELLQQYEEHGTLHIVFYFARIMRAEELAAIKRCIDSGLDVVVLSEDSQDVYYDLLVDTVESLEVLNSFLDVI